MWQEVLLERLTVALLVETLILTPASYVTVHKSPPPIPEPHESGPRPPSHPLIYT